MKADRIREPVRIWRLRDGDRAVLVDNETGHTMYFYACGRQEVAVPMGVTLRVEPPCASLPSPASRASCT